MRTIGIKPKAKDFVAWTKCVAADGDLIFVAEKDLRHLPSEAKFFPASKAKQNSRLWSLNNRSWYGYSINSRSHCAWLRTGALERISAEELRAIGITQIEAKVPTLIRQSLLPAKITRKAPLIDGHAWITAGVWGHLTKTEKVATMRAWFIQNELIHQPSLPLKEVPATVRALLRANKLDNLLHSFRVSSGGNCFAAAAAFATRNHKLLDQWMLWDPLKKHLDRSGYKLAKGGDNPQAEDILIFQVKGNPVHAAVFLGAGIWARFLRTVSVGGVQAMEKRVATGEAHRIPQGRL
jgi:hypothetical protein